MQLDYKHRRVWAEIDLDALEYNFRQLRAHLDADTRLCCVIKANAYGHGAVDVALAYEGWGADVFAVSNIEEAIQLRRGGVTRPILILGYTPTLCVSELAALELTQCVYSREYGELLSSCALREGVTLNVHLKIDTGMGRIGFAVREDDDQAAIADIAATCALPGLRVSGAFTHFAVADDGEAGEEFSRGQYALFERTMKALEQKGIEIECKHCANSAALSDYKEYHMDMVRAGIVLYGLQPSADLRTPMELRPAMTLKSVISHVKTVRAGDSISYGRTFIAKQDMKIATVPIGYADGYRRASSENGATLLIRGERCPIVGRVCMDQLMVDVSALPLVCVGDEVTVFGSSPALTAAELAALNDTVAYEMICAVGVRVPRVYLRDGKVVCVRDNLIP